MKKLSSFTVQASHPHVVNLNQQNNNETKYEHNDNNRTSSLDQDPGLFTG